MGCEEYYGNYKGYARYDVAYNYFLEASKYDHAGACYMLGNMFLKGLIGSKKNEETSKAYEYLIKAKELGNVAAINLLGVMYLNGIYPVSKDVDKAKEYFIEASKNNYSFAYNNLGNIYENNSDEQFELEEYQEDNSDDKIE